MKRRDKDEMFELMTDYRNPIDGNTFCIDLWYPRCEGSIDTIQIGLMDVRAADDIRICYDFERDGWVISMEYSIDNGDHLEDTGEWKEMAFIPAWLIKEKGC